MKPKIRLLFDCSVGFAEQFSKEAKRLKIDKIELFRQMWELWIHFWKKK